MQRCRAKDLRRLDRAGPCAREGHHYRSAVGPHPPPPPPPPPPPTSGSIASFARSPRDPADLSPVKSFSRSSISAGQAAIAAMGGIKPQKFARRAEGVPPNCWRSPRQTRYEGHAIHGESRVRPVCNIARRHASKPWGAES